MDHPPIPLCFFFVLGCMATARTGEPIGLAATAAANWLDGDQPNSKDAWENDVTPCLRQAFAGELRIVAAGVAFFDPDDEQGQHYEATIRRLIAAPYHVTLATVVEA